MHGCAAPFPASPPCCRLLAELEALRAHSGGPAAAASRGYSAADLEAEVASLQRRRDARLPNAASAAEAAVAAAVGAAVVEEQASQRQAALERRLQAKQQVGPEGRSVLPTAVKMLPIAVSCHC